MDYVSILIQFCFWGTLSYENVAIALIRSIYQSVLAFRMDYNDLARATRRWTEKKEEGFKAAWWGLQKDFRGLQEGFGKV